MTARFFYAKAVFNTWPKLFVLTDDNILYSEYKLFNKIEIIEKSIDFNSVFEDNFKFGYHNLNEISESEALETNLTFQENWIQSYLNKKNNVQTKNFNQLYLDKLNKIDSLNLVIVGQDPYKVGANGIAFCKNTYMELEQYNCCGKEVLFSLGIDLKQYKKDFSTPIELFMHLLDSGIAFINVNHGLFSENSNPEDYKDYNNQFLLKAKEIVVLGLSTAKDTFDEYYHSYSNVHYLIHPSGHNRQNSFNKWNAIWGTTYLKTNFLINN